MNLFFSLEGLDGSGKSTVGKLIAEKFDSLYVQPRLKVSGGESDAFHKSFETKYLEYMSLNSKVSDNIREGIFGGNNLFVDRYVHSTVAYHRCSIDKDLLKLSEDLVKQLDILLPDYVLFFDVSYEESVRRMGRRGGMSRNDVLLKEDAAKRECIKNAYFELLDKGMFYKKDYILIDTTNFGIEEVVDEVYKKISPLINQ